MMYEIMDMMMRAGYRHHDENPMICAKCPSAKRNEGHGCRHFCRRHQFYVHSHGYCPFFGQQFDEKCFRKEPFKQMYLFK